MKNCIWLCALLLWVGTESLRADSVPQSYTAVTAASATTSVEDSAQLEAEIMAELTENKSEETAPLPAVSSGGSTNYRLLDLSVDGIMDAGFSTVNPDLIRTLQGGGHDPRRNGFTLSQVELVAAGAVDPYVRADFNLVFNEEGVEVEEAYFRTMGLPAGLELKAGQMFVEFGRLNRRHPHQWSFIDQPVVLGGMFGRDGYKTLGGRFSWLTPLPWYVEWLGGIYNGSPNVSFLGGGEDASTVLPGGFKAMDRQVASWRDLVGYSRLLQSFDLADSTTMNLGFSGLYGSNNSGVPNQSWVLGSDLYIKWQPLSNDHGWPFVALQAELLDRAMEMGSARVLLRDIGAYAQLIWGFARRWTAAVRTGGFWKRDTTLYNRDRQNRRRASVALTWFPSEFSRLRLQYNLDDLQSDTAHSLWLQIEGSIGTHAAHTF